MLLAGIDIGTNSTRFLLAEVNGDAVHAVKSGLITTRLGQGINHGRLLPEAMERTVAAIEEFLKQIRPYHPYGIVAAATSAVRDAANREEFLRLVQQRTGLKVVVLSGEKEAAASYRGVLAGLPVAGDSTMVLDVGGGSTEMIWTGPDGLRYVSLPVGAVRMTEGGHTEEQIRELLAPTLGEIKNRQREDLALVAVGGTATTLAAMSLQLAQYRPELVHGYQLTLPEVERLLSLLVAAGSEGRKKIVGLQPERADIILAGVIIVKIVLETLALPCLTVSESDILYGLVWELGQQLSKQKLE
ncbi:Ppx/GppA phosphatase family protein [Desulforamulus putei]|uniref:Exopolyphosphatase / guanosine-5'-triphosphate,3'-diphosphate pyrophosphatase n=1 Tax=Desulforamulus putei DSM 12395 TaxID=1121429 RepID=A0A1M5B915_9FIRM|nr:Ppx/GppA phosphatase family protein [Desulforamulus putei]SHF38928.1 exopolyphosphatase / guanosine-5'-triphosphate,3'-diphosphate pyrophosphatase [Desulforamulus putei DSM 12395]